jgi:periplasmic protein TonB
MLRTEYRLLLTLTLSVLLHLLPLLPFTPPPPAPSAPPTPLQAELRQAQRPPQPLLKMDPVKPQEPAAEAENHRPPSHPQKTAAAPAKTWTQAIRHHLEKLQKEGNFYPAEAISQGLEGQVLILLIIDEGGNVVAARIEQSSGYQLLDNAALRAVRSIRSLPADAPKETLLPVRFSLR